MNVIIVIDSLVGGGAEKVMLTLAQEMTDKKHNVLILSLADSVESVSYTHLTLPTSDLV